MKQHVSAFFLRVRFSSEPLGEVSSEVEMWAATWSKLRIRKLPEAKNLRQRNIKQRTGLLRCYSSRVENRTPSERSQTQHHGPGKILPMHRVCRKEHGRNAACETMDRSVLDLVLSKHSA